MSNLILDENHILEFICWHPDDLPANRLWLGLKDDEPMPYIEKYGCIIKHKTPDGKDCEGAITLENPWSKFIQDLENIKRAKEEKTAISQLWRIISWEPLTLSPSILCKRCGDHGFIENGKWRPT